MKNTYFILKAIFVLEIFTFHCCPDFLVMQKNDLIGKLRLISNFLTSQTGHQITTIHILPVSQEVKAILQ